MIITKEMLKQNVSKDMIPKRLDSALNLYTNVKYKNKTGIIVYNINPTTWNCLYSFYELNHKFTIDNYKFTKENPTYEDLIKEYKSIYHNNYEQDKGYVKEKRINILKDEFKKTFNLSSVDIKDELEPIFELKYSKTKNVWTLYYFENYVVNKVDNIKDLFNQDLYEQKILPLDSSITNIDGVELTSNIPYLLSIESNIEKLNNNIITNIE